MQYMASENIKGEFLDFFQSNNHQRIDEAGVLPNEDPTLLYINSGMAPLKKYFTGEAAPPAQELTNAQTCIRTNDIDDVEDGTVSPLDLQSVDAGAGLERIAMIMQNAPSIHEIDKYKDAYYAIRDEVDDTRSARIVFDHLKTAQIIANSGIFPSNSREGYVLRKLLRRAYSAVQLSGLALKSIEDFSSTVRSVAGDTPHATRSHDEVDKIFQAEQQRFERAMSKAEKYIQAIESAGLIDPRLVFQAHTQNGIPIEYFRAFAEKASMDFPDKEVQALETAHRQKS